MTTPQVTFSFKSRICFWDFENENKSAHGFLKMGAYDNRKASYSSWCDCLIDSLNLWKLPGPTLTAEMLHANLPHSQDPILQNIHLRLELKISKISLALAQYQAFDMLEYEASAGRSCLHPPLSLREGPEQSSVWSHAFRVAWRRRMEGDPYRIFPLPSFLNTLLNSYELS